jgi:hypothetical protein
MKDENKLKLIKTSWQLHDQVETEYLLYQAKKGESEWLEKQRLLVADMALHLLQTCIKPGEIDLERFRDNLHAILTISDQFLPSANLREATKKLYK